METIKKYQFEIVFAFFVVAFFFFSRLYNLGALPIFTDEAIYVRWSQIARYDAAWRFISLTDGKQPSFVWLTTTAMRLIDDPLIAGRIVSVFSGFLSLIGLFFLGRELFGNKWIGGLSSIVYLFYPMALVYDRMALYDSLVGTFAIWSFYLIVLLVRRVRLDIALILGMVFGGGVLTKTSGFFSAYLLPFSLLLFDWNRKELRKRILKWIGLACVSVVLMYLYYSVLRLSPFFHIISQKNSIFVYPLNEWLEHPLRFLQGNLRGEWDWLITYLTWPIFLLIVGSFVIDRIRFREKILLVVWFFIPFFFLALFGRVLYPRFIFFMTLFLLPLASYTLITVFTVLKNKVLFVIFFLAFLTLSIRTDYYILTNFAKSPIPRSDLGQYINGWPAGGGVKEIINFLKGKSSNQNIFVASEGTFGSLPTYSVEIYLGDNKRISKQGIWPITEDIPKNLSNKAKTMPVYFIFNDSQKPPEKWPLKFLAKYQKGIGNSYMSLYEVIAK